MIRCSYELIRDTGDGFKEKFNIVPKLQNIHNISLIEGPMGSSKSTYLNILALSLYGHKNNEVKNPKILAKMKSLLEAERNKLSELKVEISSEHDRIKLISTYNPKNKDFTIIEKIGKTEKKLDYKQFQDKYKLIYDIPDDPIDRLSKITEDVKEQQSILAQKITALKMAIINTQRAISSGRDPEQISKLTKDIEENEKARKIKEKEIEGCEKDLAELEKYTYNYFFHYYQSKLNQAIRSKEKIEHRERKEAVNKKKTNVEYGQNIDIAKHYIEEMRGKFVKISDFLKITLPEDKKHLLNIWNKIDLNDSLTSFEFSDTFEELLLDFQKILKTQISELQNKDEIKEAQLWRKLLEVFEEYSGMNPKIPGIHRSVKDIVSDLTRSLTSVDIELQKIKNMEEIDGDLAILNRQRKNLMQDLFPTLKKLSVFVGKDETQSYIDNEDDLKKANDEYNSAKEKFDTYDQKFAAINRPQLTTQEQNTLQKKYGLMKEEQLLNRIRGLKNDEAEFNAKFNKFDHVVKILEKDKKALLDKKPHKYQNKKDELEQIKEDIEELETKFTVDLKQYLEALEKPKESLSKNKFSKEQLEYNEQIFLYLGKRLDKFYYGEDQFTAITVNLITRIIDTKEKRKISLDDLSTGNSQLGYLKSLLSKEERKTLIVFFDEVAMIGEKGANEVFEVLNELYNKDKLLVGLLAQSEKKFEVTSKIK